MPPNAPPVATWVTRTLGFGQAQERGDLAAVLPGALALREDVESRRSPAGPGRPGHRQRRLGLQERMLDALGLGTCRVTTWAAPASAASTSPRPMTRASRAGCRRRGRAGAPGGEGRDRVGDRLEHLVLDLDQRSGASRAASRGRRRRRRPARRPRSGSSRPRRRTAASRASDQALDALAGHVAAVTTATTPGMRGRA